jgi:hypothetical protein
MKKVFLFEIMSDTTEKWHIRQKKKESKRAQPLRSNKKCYVYERGSSGNDGIG